MVGGHSGSWSVEASDVLRNIEVEMDGTEKTVVIGGSDLTPEIRSFSVQAVGGDLELRFQPEATHAAKRTVFEGTSFIFDSVAIQGVSLYLKGTAPAIAEIVTAKGLLT